MGCHEKVRRNVMVSSNTRKYDSVIKNVEDESERHRKDGMQYLEDSKGEFVKMYLNNKLCNEGKLIEIHKDYFSSSLLIKFDNGKTEKLPFTKTVVENDEDMEFPAVYFDYRKSEVVDEELIKKEDDKIFEEMEYKMRHGGPKKKLKSSKFEQTIIMFEIIK